MRDGRADELETLCLAMQAFVRGKIPMRVLRTKEASCLKLPVADGPELGFLHFMGATKELDWRGASRADAVFAVRAELVRLLEVCVFATPPLLRPSTGARHEEEPCNASDPRGACSYFGHI